MIKSKKLQRYISTALGEVCLADNVTELEAVNDELWQAIKALTTNHEAAHAPKETNIKPDNAQAARQEPGRNELGDYVAGLFTEQEKQP